MGGEPWGVHPEDWDPRTGHQFLPERVKPISWKRLRRATEQVFGEPPAFVPVREGWDLFTNGPPRLADIGSDPGIYAFYASAMRVIYSARQ